MRACTAPLRRSKPVARMPLRRADLPSDLRPFRLQPSRPTPPAPRCPCAPHSARRFTRKLKKVTAEQGARFVSYDPAPGTWRFEVEHFSKYGLLDSEEEEEGGAEGGAGGGAARHAQQQQRQRQRSGGGGESSDEELQGFGVGARRRGACWSGRGG